MDPVISQKPQSANDYDDRTTRAVKSVLVEIGQILASFRGKFAVILNKYIYASLQSHAISCRTFADRTPNAKVAGWTPARATTNPQ
jgi:hypothetical protein